MLYKKMALVAGAAQGIGELVARRYATEGAHVIVADKNIKALERVYDLISDQGGKATIAAIDFNNADEIKELAKNLNTQFKKIDILVGIDCMLGEIKPLVDYCIETWNSILSSNLTANWHLIRCFDPLLKISDCPRVICITSEIVSKAENFFYGPYAASKAALESLLKTYANENKRSSLRANLIELTMRTDRPEHDLDNFYYKADDSLAQIFVDLASEYCKLTGRKHLVQY